MITIVNSEDGRIEKPVAEALLQLLTALTAGSEVRTIRPRTITIVKHETFGDTVTTFVGHPEAMYYLRIVADAAKNNPNVFSQYKE